MIAVGVVLIIIGLFSGAPGLLLVPAGIVLIVAGNKNKKNQQEQSSISQQQEEKLPPPPPAPAPAPAPAPQPEPEPEPKPEPPEWGEPDIEGKEDLKGTPKCGANGCDECSRKNSCTHNPGYYLDRFM